MSLEIIRFKPHTISVVNIRGYSHGMLTSKNIKSKSHIIAMLTTMLKNPNVIILKGRVITFKTGFKKKFSSPKIIPKSKKICHSDVNGKPKKLESGYILITTPGTNRDDNHNPAKADAI